MIINLCNNVWNDFVSGLGNVGNVLSGGLLGTIGSVFGLGSSALQNSMSVGASKELMDYQYQLNKAFINDQREYDKPQAQMARLAEAGLNPNLVYGSGSVVGNTSSTGSVSLGRAAQSELSKYYEDAVRLNLAKSAAEVDNIKTDTEVKESQKELNESSKYRNLEQGSVYSQLYRWNEATWDLRKETVELQRDLLSGNIKMIGKQFERLDQEIINSKQITESTLKTMAQARDYQIKQFNLDEKRLGEMIRHNKRMESVGFANARALMIGALAQQLNAKTNSYDAETRRKNYELAEKQFDKMSDAQLGRLYQQTLNDIAYRQNYLYNLGPYMEQRSINMDTQQRNMSLDYMERLEYSPYNAAQDLINLIPNQYFKQGSILGF